MHIGVKYAIAGTGAIVAGGMISAAKEGPAQSDRTRNGLTAAELRDTIEDAAFGVLVGGAGAGFLGLLASRSPSEFHFPLRYAGYGALLFGGLVLGGTMTERYLNSRATDTLRMSR